MLTYTGFKHENRIIKFIEPKGKDISFPRWRVCLYYAPNFALTHFESTEADYNKFLADHAGECFTDYITFHKYFWHNAA